MTNYINCKICAKEMRVYPYQIKKNRQFCSVSCRGKYNTAYTLENQSNLVKERFFKNTDIIPDGCWLWKKSKDRDGYGVMFDHGKYKTAHRYSWELHNGSIPKGEMICHKCDNPLCVNPEHLFLGTALDNNRDRVRKGRSNTAYGEKHSQAKLTQNDVVQIRKDLKNGMEIKHLAKEYKTHPANISKIKNYTTWKHVQEIP